MQAPIITLVTDWGTSDFFGGMFKGHLLRALPEARVVDIAMDIPPFQTIKACTVVRHACPAFPQGTIHIIDVDGGRRGGFIAAELDGQFYLCADNGLLFSAFGRRCDRAVRLEVPEGAALTFVADTLLLPAAVQLAQGTPLEQLGERVQEVEGPVETMYDAQAQEISVTVTHTDRYGNAYLALTREEFERVRQGRPFVATVGDTPLRSIRNDYTPPDLGTDDLSIVESSTGVLQIAVCQDSAEKLLGIKPRTSVKFRFF